jgi:hypothetical protein
MKLSWVKKRLKVFFSDFGQQKATGYKWLKNPQWLGFLRSSAGKSRLSMRPWQILELINYLRNYTLISVQSWQLSLSIETLRSGNRVYHKRATSSGYYKFPPYTSNSTWSLTYDTTMDWTDDIYLVTKD